MPMLSAALIADVQHRLAYQDTGCDPASETMNLVKAVDWYDAQFRDSC